MNEIKPGMIVRYSPDWCTPGERHLLHLVRENRMNPVTGEMTRFLITTLNSNLFLPPSEVVDDVMLEPTGFTLDDVPAGTNGTN